jgi:hypothetical protein
MRLNDISLYCNRDCIWEFPVETKPGAIAISVSIKPNRARKRARRATAARADSMRVHVPTPVSPAEIASRQGSPHCRRARGTVCFAAAGQRESASEALWDGRTGVRIDGHGSDVRHDARRIGHGWVVASLSSGRSPRRRPREKDFSRAAGGDGCFITPFPFRPHRSLCRTVARRRVRPLARGQ